MIFGQRTLHSETLLGWFETTLVIFFDQDYNRKKHKETVDHGTRPKRNVWGVQLNMYKQFLNSFWNDTSQQDFQIFTIRSLLKHYQRSECPVVNQRILRIVKAKQKQYKFSILFYFILFYLATQPWAISCHASQANHVCYVRWHGSPPSHLWRMLTFI